MTTKEIFNGLMVHSLGHGKCEQALTEALALVDGEDADVIRSFLNSDPKADSAKLREVAKKIWSK